MGSPRKGSALDNDRQSSKSTSVDNTVKKNRPSVDRRERRRLNRFRQTYTDLEQKSTSTSGGSLPVHDNDDQRREKEQIHHRLLGSGSSGRRTGGKGKGWSPRRSSPFPLKSSSASSSSNSPSSSATQSNVSRHRTIPYSIDNNNQREQPSLGSGRGNSNSNSVGNGSSGKAVVPTSSSSRVVSTNAKNYNKHKSRRSPSPPKRSNFNLWSSSTRDDPGTPVSAYRSLPDPSPPRHPSSKQQFLFPRFGLRRSSGHLKLGGDGAGSSRASRATSPNNSKPRASSPSSRLSSLGASPSSQQYASDPEPSSHRRLWLEQHEEIKSQHRRMVFHPSPSPTSKQSIRSKDHFIAGSDPARRSLEESLFRHALAVPCINTEGRDDNQEQRSETIVFSPQSDEVEVVATRDRENFINGDSRRQRGDTSDYHTDNGYTDGDNTDGYRDDDSFSFTNLMNRNQTTTSELHSLCQTMTSIDDVNRAKTFFIGSFIDDVAKVDYKGETPLHAFANNKQLSAVIENPNNVEFETKDYLTLYRQPTFDQNSANQLHAAVLNFLVDELLPCFPAAMAVQDHHSFIPFEAGLVDWIALCQTPPLGSPLYRNDNTSYFSVYTRKAVSQVWETTSSTIINAAKFGGRTMSIIGSEIGPSSQRHNSMANDNDVETGRSHFSRMKSANHESTSGSMASTKELVTGASSSTDDMYVLTPHARYCLEMLSFVVDELEKYSNAASSKNYINDHGNGEKREKLSRAVRGIRMFHDKWGEDVDICDTVVQAIASIPNLLKTILFIHDESELEFALSTSIIRRVMVQKQSVGRWLTSMIQSPNKETSQRAVEYLEAVSKLCSGKDTFRGKTNRPDKGKDSDEETYSSRMLVDEVSRLQDFIPSLLSLGDRGIEQASTTLIVRKVLNRMIARPFAATVFICDAIFLILMIAGFRMAVNQMIKGAPFDVVLKSCYVSNVGIFYFVITEIGKAVALLQITKNARRYFMTFWNIIDITATGLALVSSVFIRWKYGEDQGDDQFLRGLLAVTTGFLWLKVLSFLKIINLQLATFILAIIQITKDILWFALILLVLVVCVSQMFMTLLAPSTCATGDASEDECSLSYFLLQSYTILMGEFNFEKEAFSTATWFSVLLVVLYSFLVTVVLLNVLIAVASDSYEKCQLKTQKLFGRARVCYVAELSSFQSLLRKRDNKQSPPSPSSKRVVYSQWWTSTRYTNNWSRGSILFFTLSLLVVVGWTFAEVGGFLNGDQEVSILLSLSSVIVNAVLFAGIIIFLDRHASVVSQDKKDLVDDKTHGWSTSFLQRAVHRLLGATPSGGLRRKRMQDEWNGRVHFLQHEMNRNNNNTKELILNQSKNLKSLVHESQAGLQSEMSNMENRFRLLESTINQTNENVIEAVSELKALISLAGSSSGERSPVPSEVDIGAETTPVRRSYDRHG
mmetsp:Transcript_56571/g.137360  ORF Transcript_56571/g.137360 Transcript_56571/m.137360 type:complete len:1430 (-) Transcript_56571:877-5166(-)